jgi:hypothetical protein
VGRQNLEGAYRGELGPVAADRGGFVVTSEACPDTYYWMDRYRQQSRREGPLRRLAVLQRYKCRVYAPA